MLSFGPEGDLLHLTQALADTVIYRLRDVVVCFDNRLVFAGSGICGLINAAAPAESS